ncbi:MAG: hypothetical protein DMG14_01380, partial [Acidobacteria bacterium]
LLQRMQLLVTEVSMSKFRLVSSYALIAATLAVAGWVVFVSFPLTGRAEVKEAAAVQPQQSSPGYVVNIQPLSYPKEAIDKKIEGTVVVELTFNASGNIVDARVLSGPEELRRAALESALRGSYSINVARTLQVLVGFRLANARALVPPRPPAPPPPPVPPAPPTPPPPAPRTQTDRVLDTIEIRGLSEPQLSQLQERVRPFEGQVFRPEDFWRQLQAAARGIGIGLPANYLVYRRQDHVRIEVSFGDGVPEIQTPFSTASVGAAPQTPFGPQAAPTPHADVTQDFLVADLVSRVLPAYPPLAVQARIQGVVVLEADIGTQGTVEDVRIVTGHPLFRQVTIDAVKQWVYRPQANPVTTRILINFRF